MIAMWMRNPKITAKQFLEFAALYNEVSNKRTKMKGKDPEPTPDDLNEMVLKLEGKKHG